MTDKEIIKALECCDVTSGDCVNCPAKYRRRSDCIRILTRDTIELINRQQAEIDKLLVQSGHFDTFARNLCGTRLRNGNKIATFEDLQSYISKQKAEAVREFADRLKRMMFITDYDIDDLVDELYGNPEEIK